MGSPIECETPGLAEELIFNDFHAEVYVEHIRLVFRSPRLKVKTRVLDVSGVKENEPYTQDHAKRLETLKVIRG
jgi:hypothetical protein